MPPSLPRTRQQQTLIPFVSKSDEALLAAVNRYHLATAEQLCCAVFGSKSHGYVRGKVSHLATAGYLLRSDDLRPFGPLVYSLGPQGRDYLQSLGHDVPERLRKAVVKRYGYQHLKHALGVTDILIAADRLAKQDTRIRVHAVLNEYAAKRTSMRVALPKGEKVTVCPDAWLDLRLATTERLQTCLALEFDRGSEWQPAWRQKVRAILTWAKGPYRSIFGTESLTVAVIVDAGPESQQRLATLLHWTEAELAEQNAQAAAELFCLGICETASITPANLFLRPTFRVPFSPAPTSLLPLEQGAV
jgi:hypothetical protein